MGAFFALLRHHAFLLLYFCYAAAWCGCVKIFLVMGHVKMPDGMEFTTSDSSNGNKTGWSAGVPAFVGGGIAGYLLGENRGNGCNRRGRNNCNDGCGDDAVVTRFELKQAEIIGNKDAEIAYLRGQNESKDYTNAAILELRKELIGRDDKQDVVTASLIQSSIDQQVNIKGLQTGLGNLADSTTRELEVLAASANREFRSIEAQFATERAISDCRYIAQPRVKICGKSYDFECADPAVTVASVASTVKTVKA